MAVMWPRELPVSIKADRRKRAEVRTYDRLAAALDDSFTVFYSSPWLGVDSHGAEKDGECDFLVAHPRLGYLAIEVKGGGISFDPQTRKWTSRDENHFRHTIKDPVAQARDAKHELLKKLKACGKWQTRYIRMAHGVIFPNAAAPPADLGADRPARLFCCSDEFAHGLRAWVGQRLHEGRDSASFEPLGADGVAALTHILAKPFQLHFSIAARMADAAEHLGILEPTQFHILDNIADIDRAEIRGGAGTGKTVIAAEEALRLARAGRRTLLTCHSAPLAGELSRRLSAVDGLTVTSFHSLCGTLAKRAGVKVSGHGSALYEDHLPGALIDAAALLPSERWDAVVVDEGQDFRQNWWIALTSIMDPDCRVRVMSDSNQRVYDAGRTPGLDLELVPIRLKLNLRNTQVICDAASAHYSGPEIKAVGPAGPPVEWIMADGADALTAAAAAELRRLLHREDVSTSDVAVLLPSSDWVERFRIATAKSGLGFVSAEELRAGEVVVDTVRRFKGLERPAVLLVVAPSDMQSTELAYVGMTRPKTYLAVVSSGHDQKWLREIAVV
ncbi:MAG: NERD domain-containing protein [Proteobacteria bacterium]|nr:NERD domain-containing protein [Pseudomonadota bacterium]